MSMFADIQQAIYTALATDGSVDALLARQRDPSGEPTNGPAVYDHVPQPPDGADDSWFPYITIGDNTSDDWDTDTERGLDTTVTIHVWSRSRGRMQAREIQGAVYEALHRYDAIPVDGQDTVLMQQEMAQVLVDPDGKTRHGVQRFRLLTDNV